MTYTLEQLYEMAEQGQIDWSVYDRALQSQQELIADRSFHLEQAIGSYQAEQEANHWMASQDAMYGTNLQQQAAELRARCQQSSQQGMKRASLE